MSAMTYFVYVCVVALLCTLTSAQGSCGGCTGVPTTERVCTKPGTNTSSDASGDSDAATTVTRTVTVMEAYTCYTYRRYFFWVLAREKRCYRKVYRQVTELVPVRTGRGGDVETHTNPCCEGYVRTTPDTCSRCGRNKYDKSTSGATKMIVGGATTLPNQYPWLVRLTSHYYGYYTNCGGTIIGKRWILTAAHCVHGSYISYSYATVGDHDQRKSHEGATEKSYSYAKLHTHPDYKRASGVASYDIALIETSQDIEFNEDVRPACLPEGRAKYMGETVTVAGWGRIVGGSTRLPVNLQHATAEIVDPRRCNNYIYKNVLCAEGNDMNVCTGDSGGPMVHTDNGYSTVIGISWWSVRGCPKGSQFGYTDVGVYIDWINGVMFD